MRRVAVASAGRHSPGPIGRPTAAAAAAALAVAVAVAVAVIREEEE